MGREREEGRARTERRKRVGSGEKESEREGGGIYREEKVMCNI